MPRTVETEPLQKHTLLLYEGDFEKLGAYYPQIGASVAVRRIVRSFLNRINDAAPAADIKVETLDV